MYEKSGRLKKKSAKLAKKVARANTKLYKLNKKYNKKTNRFTHSDLDQLQWIDEMLGKMPEMTEAEKDAFYCMVDDMYPEEGEELLDISDEDLDDENTVSDDEDDADDANEERSVPSAEENT